MKKIKKVKIKKSLRLPEMSCIDSATVA